MSIKALPRKTLFMSILLANALLAASSYAGPQGGNITHGSGSIGSQGNTTSIMQNTNQLIIDWNSFNVNSNEKVNFTQPGASSVALNNILQYDASRINGQINANGQVILINPRGLIFGSGAEINTAGLIVSSLSIAKKAFLNGNFAFKDLDDSQGVIINNGAIYASSGGVTLLGESIVNNGVIQADLGYINLAAGKQAFLSFDEQGFLGVKIDQDVINNELGLEQAIENNGELSAGGRVAISAKVTSELFDRAINNTGMIKATGFNLSALKESPSITLNANGDINNSGTLNAENHSNSSSSNLPVHTEGGHVAINGHQVIHTGTIDVSSDFGLGGQAHILGDQVGLTGGAIVNADGETGGGNIQIGGSYQGKDSQVKNAEATYVGEGSKISANAGVVGDGGEIVVWADNTTRYYGDIEAQGGSQRGNGGTVEVSGKQTLSFDGTVDTSADKGLSGELLLDPETLTIVADDVAESDNDFSGGEVTFSEPEPVNATIKASTVVTLLEANNVKLTATDLITVAADIDASGSINTLELFSNGDINVNALIQVGGILELIASNNINLINDITAENIQLSSLNLSGNGSIFVSNVLDISNISNSILYDGLVQGTGLSTELITSTNNNIFDLTNNINEFMISNATFIDFLNVDAESNGTLNGSNSDDNFQIVANQSVLVKGTTFNKVTTVVAGDGDDDVQYDSVDWTIQGTEATSIEGIAFIDVESINQFNSTNITNRNLNGTAGDDAFGVEDTNAVSAMGITYYGIGMVNAGNGSDDVQHTATNWTVQGANETRIEDIDFSGIDSVNKENSDGITNRSLEGTSGQDLLNIESTNAISANGITYYGIGFVDAQGNTVEDVDTVSGSKTWDLLNTGFKSSGISFLNTEVANSVSDGSLEGTGSKDEFLITGTQSVLINGTTFNQITNVDAKGNNGDTVTGSDTWTLTSSDFESSGITFQDTEFVISTILGTLNGTSSKDEFEISDTNNEVEANGTIFGNIKTVDAQGDSDSDTVSGVNTWDLLLTGFEASGIEFLSTEVANSGSNGALNGTDLKNDFEIIGTQSVGANGTIFNQVTKVDAKGNTVAGEFDTVSGSNTWDLLNTGFESSGISFLNTEVANSVSDGSLEGTGSKDEFLITGTQSVLINGTTFNQITNVDAKGNNGDTVTGSDTWTLTSSDFESSGITFQDTEFVISTSPGTLNGTSSKDEFEISATNNEVEANGTIFGNIKTVDAQGDSDTVSGVNTWDLLLTGFEASGIEFLSTEVANSGSNGALNGSSSNDNFQIVANQSVLVKGTTFNQVTTVVAGDGDDDVQRDSSNWTIQAANTTTRNGIEFFGIESVNKFNSAFITDRSITGTNGQDNFSIIDTNTIKVNGITYYGIGTVDAVDNPDGDYDRVIGEIGQTWTVIRDGLFVDGFSGSDVLFRNIQIADSQSSGTLIGTDFAEKFVTTGNANEIIFENFFGFLGISTVDAKAEDLLSRYNTDKLYTNNEVSESFVINADGDLLGNGIIFIDFEKAFGESIDTVTAPDSQLVYGLNLDGDVYTFSSNFTHDTGGVKTFDYTPGADVDSVSFNSLATDGTETFRLIKNANGKYQIVVLVGGVEQTTSAEFLTLLSVDGIDNNDTFLFDSSVTLESTINFDTSSNVFSSALTGANGTIFSNFKIYDLSQLGNELTIGFTASTASTTFSLVGGNNNQLAFAGTEFGTEFHGFNNVTSDSGLLNTLEGSAQADSFSAITGNALFANGIAFNDIATVNAGDGDDDIEHTLASWGIQRDDNTTTVESINFTGIDSINKDNSAGITDRTLAGTIGEDFFVSEGTNAVSANGITYYGIGTVDAGSSNDDIQHDAANWTIQGANETSINGIAFSSIESINKNNSVGITNRSLEGTSGQDLLNIESTNVISANGITYYGIGSVNAQGNTLEGLDTVSGSNMWSLKSTGFESTGITFTNTEVANSGATGKVNGTELKDEFVIAGTQSVFANGTTFNQVTNVDAKGNTVAGELDSVSGSNTWNLNSTGFESTGITFTNTEVANSGAAGTVNGTEFKDEFVIAGTQSVAANSTTFNQVTRVDAKGNTVAGEFDTVSGSNMWSLKSTGFDSTGITFTNTEVANSGAAGTVNGTELKDEFVIGGIQSVAVNGTTFNQVTKVDAKGNTVAGELDTVSGSNTWDLLSIGFKASDISFTNTEVANSGAAGTVNGTELKDEFVIAGIQSVAVNGTTFNQVTKVDAKGNTVASELDTVSGSNTWDLLSVGFKASDISFTNTEVANSGAAGTVNGTELKDEFVIAGTQSVFANGTTFNQVTRVDAKGNTVAGELDTVSGSNTWDLLSVGFKASDISFTNTEVANSGSAGTVNGTELKDEFVIAGIQSVFANGTTFNQVTRVDAKGNTVAGELDTVSGSNTWNLQSTGFDSTGITFNNTEVANSGAAGTVNGTELKDEFVIAGTQSVIANGTTFNQVTTVDARGNTVAGELDTVAGSNTWDLLTVGFKASDVSFVNTEVANSGSLGTLKGTTATDRFKLEGAQSVAANGTTFNQVTLVNAQGTNNILLGMDGNDDFYLSSVNSEAENNKITSQEIYFNNITDIDGGTGENWVHGSVGIDSFQLTTKSQELRSNKMTFNNIQTVIAAEGNDNLIGLEDQSWQVSNTDNTIVAQDINFTEIETISNSGSGSLFGSNQADQFVLVSSNGSATNNAVMINQLLFSNIGRIDAGANGLGEDIVTSNTAQNWQLASGSDFIANGIVLSNIERATAESSVVTGSILEDVFETTTITNTVIANDVEFENVTLLDGNLPGLSLTYFPDQVAAADKLIINSSNNITITQGDGVDTFSQSGNQNNFTFDFKNIEVVDIVTTGNVNSTSGFEYLTVDATNLSINTSEDITVNNFNITNDLVINSQGDVVFLNDAEFTGRDVNLSAEDLSFRGGLSIASNTFEIDANSLNVDGDIDADVNAERSVATDIGQDINLSIFSSIDIFLASDSSILRKDEIDNADRLKRLLEETKIEL